MFNKENWEETKQKLCNWWKFENTDGPIIRAPMINTDFTEKKIEYVTLTERMTSLECAKADIYNQLNSVYYTAESYPNASLDFGPGSTALYLGSEPGFSDVAGYTVWFEPFCLKDDEEVKIEFDENNFWLKKHLELFDYFTKGYIRQDSPESFFLNIPDLVEDLDVYASLRTSQKALYDLYDKPEKVKKALKEINEVYLKYYKLFYDRVKFDDGSSAFTAFNIWAPGTVTKIQCDINAMLSAEHFREFVVPGLSKICKEIDYVLYHLDGPEAIHHVDALLEIKELDAIQWMPGTVPPDGASEKWYPLYKKILDAGKGLQIHIWKNNYDDWINAMDKIIKKFGSKGIYFLLPDLTKVQVDKLLIKRDRDWKNG